MPIEEFREYAKAVMEYKMEIQAPLSVGGISSVTELYDIQKYKITDVDSSDDTIWLICGAGAIFVAVSIVIVVLLKKKTHSVKSL